MNRTRILSQLQFSRERLFAACGYLAVCSILAAFYSQINIHNAAPVDIGKSWNYQSWYASFGIFFNINAQFHLLPILLYITTSKKPLTRLGRIALAIYGLTIAVLLYVVADPIPFDPSADSSTLSPYPFVLSSSLFMLLYLLTKPSGSRLLKKFFLVAHSEISHDALLRIRKMFVFITVVSGAILGCFYSQINQHPEAAYEGDDPSQFPNLTSTLTLHAFVAIYLQSPVLYAYLVLMTNRAATYLAGLVLLTGNLVASGVHYIYVNRSEHFYIFTAPTVWTLLVPTSLGLIYWLTVSRKREQRPQMTFADSEKLNLGIPPPPR